MGTRHGETRVKVQGVASLPGSREQVWEILTDPEKLAKILPGCERLEADGAGKYKVSVKFGIAAISGKYAGSVELSEQKRPESLHMKLEGKGAPGFMRGEGRVQLIEKKGKTEVHYEGDAQVGGLIASVGQRMIEATAKKIIQQVFESATKQLEQSTAKK